MAAKAIERLERGLEDGLGVPVELERPSNPEHEDLLAWIGGKLDRMSFRPKTSTLSSSAFAELSESASQPTHPRFSILQ